MRQLNLSTTAACVGLLAMAAPAGAMCMDQVVELEQRLEQADTGPDRRTSVDVGGGQKDITVEAEEGGVEPQENWFGSPPSLAGAQDEIDSAREMAQDGNEDGCMSHVRQARQMIEGLER